MLLLSALGCSAAALTAARVYYCSSAAQARLWRDAASYIQVPMPATVDCQELRYTCELDSWPAWHGVAAKGVAAMVKPREIQLQCAMTVGLADCTHGTAGVESVASPMLTMPSQKSCPILW